LVGILPMIFLFWRASYSADMVRRFAYAVGGLPLTLFSLVLVLVGRQREAARYQRRLAGRLVWRPAGTLSTRRASAKVIAVSVVMLAVGLPGGCGGGGTRTRFSRYRWPRTA
jgi:hypothetical protein